MIATGTSVPVTVVFLSVVVPGMPGMLPRMIRTPRRSSSNTIGFGRVGSGR